MRNHRTVSFLSFECGGVMLKKGTVAMGMCAGHCGNDGKLARG